MKTEHYESRVDSASARVNYREKWLHLLKQSRRIYFYQQWADQRVKRKVRISEMLRWAYADFRYILIWNINILLQLRAYGVIIRKVYGLSYIQQWYRMAYLAFVLRTRPNRFRLAHLYKKEQWSRVKEFTFSRHIKVNNGIFGYPHREELGILAHKLKFYEFCKTKKLQTPEILGVFEQGSITYPTNRKFILPKKDLFVKELASGQGFGAQRFNYQKDFYIDSDGKSFSEKEVCDFLIDYSLKKNGILVQHAFKNHDSWKKFTSGGLATCRIVTGISPINDTEIVPFFASMKMPTGNIVADNFSKGSLVASVNIQSGVMSSAITFVPKNGVFVFDVHPDTGHPIKGEILPFWDELIEFTKNVHKHFQTLSIGWDVSFTEFGKCVLEGNVEWGSSIIEAPAARPIADTVYPEWFDGWARRMKDKEIIPYKLPWY